MTAPAGGRMAWSQALAGPLAGLTCLWQDLDGLHVEPAPASPPPTSILWGWCDRYLLRARLDGGTAFIAIHDVSAGEPVSVTAGSARLLPWAPGDGRIAASRGRGPSAPDGGVGATYEQIVVEATGAGTGPVTFLRPGKQAQVSGQDTDD